jgi:hypothetical protein
MGSPEQEELRSYGVFPIALLLDLPKAEMVLKEKRLPSISIPSFHEQVQSSHLTFHLVPDTTR